MGMGDYSPGSVWYYAPNKAAPIMFIVLFLVSGVLHAYQTMKHKSWRTTLLLPWASLLMIAGFSMRLAGAYHTSSLGILIASTVLIMSGPPVYALINYFVLSRLLYYMPYLAPLHPGRVATTFIGLDGVCEILIGNGAWRMANSSMTASQRQAGANMVMASLSLQAALFAGFGVLAALFHRKALRAGVLTRGTKTVLCVMYVSAAIVTVRCIYRLVEYVMGWDSEIYKNEVYFWVFEAGIMWINTALLNVFHPGKRLPRSNGTFLTKDGVTERRGPGWDDDRPWPVTIFDPLDIWGLIRGKDRETKFWDMSDEELERVRLEKKANKRSVVGALLDPFRLWGERGYVERHFLKKNKVAGRREWDRAARNCEDTNVSEARG
ncbi:putative RTA1 domain protein [Didymella exigua CBS 183.55]|uniref:Putative RTA1 domain protein n=1 Tax=Didymella exigua CBS 183.55 TaxID=1150837 RepID=A0A6A5RM88_9PLEO|nr:putative RTA1 domain protein [Didymella exigua CBS 183.55]KAF1926657.1 putative RTA1 domain protein [Didymella exigua CBS 183.55]